MSRVFVRGVGAVSPAGWGVEALRSALKENRAIPTKTIKGPSSTHETLAVPPPLSRTGALAHPRLRRASGISQFAMGAAEEALGGQAAIGRLGIVLATQVASIRYSERFFEEALRDPASASPMLFPETVVNAAASHLAAAFGRCDLVYSLMGDQTGYFQALAVAATWLAQDRVDSALVVGAEECGWTLAEAMRLFAKGAVPGEGAGALLLSREAGAVELEFISDPEVFQNASAREGAVERLRARLQAPRAGELLVDSQTGNARWDANAPCGNWVGAVISPRRILGEALAAATAWQFVIAVTELREKNADAATVVTIGSNQQAMAARLIAN